jgi:hypothetical protein
MPLAITEVSETAHIAALNSSHSKIVAELLRDLPRKHRDAFRDFYLSEDDDATVCARNGLSLIAWRDLKGQVRARFLDRRTVGG